MKPLPLLLLLLTVCSSVAEETQTVVYDFATKPEETRRRVYEQANVANLAAQREPRPPLKGRVIQRLAPDRCLVAAEDGSTFLLDVLPGRSAVLDGSTVSCPASYLGIYQYHTVEGVPKQVAHWKEMTEAERTGKKWKTYPEFCAWLKLGHTCVLRKKEPIRCAMCHGTGVVRESSNSRGSPCSRCGGRGRDTLTTVYNLVWTVPSRTPQPVAPAAAPPSPANRR